MNKYAFSLPKSWPILEFSLTTIVVISSITSLIKVSMCFSFATLKSSLKDEFAIFKFFLDLKRNSLVHLVSLFKLARIFDVKQQKGTVQIIIIKR